MYAISLKGAELHHYAAEAGIPGSYGWAAVDGLWGRKGEPVLFEMRCEAEDWMRGHAVFCGGAEVAEATAPLRGASAGQSRGKPLTAGLKPEGL